MKMGSGAIIETQNLTKDYGKHSAVKALTFSVQEGEIFGFLGPNGAGKTTTILMLLGLTQPSSGAAKVCGLDPVRNAREVKRIVGYLPENVGFYGELDAIQSLEYIADLNGIMGHKRDEKIRNALETVGLADNAYKKVAAFSRGMRQRLGIAEVLLKEPRVMILDEPTLGLDPDGALQLIELIRSLNRDKGITVLVSSHNLNQVQRISHRVGIMIKGSMVAKGSMDALAKESLGIEDGSYSLEEIYMKYFQEG
jgi:ABC-2 type transport system ATP-binding protein